MPLCPSLWYVVGRQYSAEFKMVTLLNFAVVLAAS